MDLATLIVSCSLVSTPLVQDTLFRVVLAHSAGEPHLVFNASTQRSYSPPARAKAAALATRLAAAHHHVVLGLAGLPYRRLAAYKLSAGEALEPCTNIALASLELEALLGARGRITQARLHKVLARYLSPQTPDKMIAIEWGARVLAQPRISVRAQMKTPHKVASRNYTITRVRLRGGNPTGKHPRRLMLKPATRKKAREADDKKRPEKLDLKPDDLTPRDPIKKPVTNKRLP